MIYSRKELMIKKVRTLAMTCLSLMAVSAQALETKAQNYTPVNGGQTSFDKYLIIDKDANVPAATFSFTIASGTASAATESSMEVLAGPATASAPSITSGAVFEPGDDTYASAQEGDIITLGANEKYAFKTVTIDFSGVSFEEPGIYRYIVSETPLDQPGAFTQDQNPKTLDVYVTDNNGYLTIASYVLHSDTAAPARNDTGGSHDVAEALDAVKNKVTGFINRYSTKDLTITKQVSGNQASKDKYFHYTLNITNAGAGSIITADVSTNAEVEPLTNQATVYTADTMKAANNVAVLTCDETGAITHDFYLKHNQSITLKQLPKGASWTLTEAAEDYVSQDLSAVNAATYSANSGTIADQDVTIGFMNTRNGVIPTGIMLSTAPYLLMVLLAGTGMILAGRKHAIR